VSAVAAERRHVLVEREFLGGRELAAAAFHQTEILAMRSTHERTSSGWRS